MRHQPDVHSTGRARRAGAAAWLALLAVGVLAGCSNVRDLPPPTAGELERVADGAGHLAVSPPLPDVDALFAMTDEMREFARVAVGERRGIGARSQALANALLAEDGRALVYDGDAALTASEAFEQRRVNCLSYAMLFTAMARSVGLHPEFNEVDVPPTWDLGPDDYFVLYRHVNVRVDMTASRYTIVDITPGEFDPVYPQRRIDLTVTAAQYYNNRGVIRRGRGDLQAALEDQVVALRLAPDQAYLWSNLSSLYLKLGDEAAAKTAAQRAMQLDPGSVSAVIAAAQALASSGNARFARQLRAEARRMMRDNPYFHYQQAIAALEKQDHALAVREARDAIRLYPHDPKFFLVASVALRQLGEADLARRSYDTAMQLTRDPVMRKRYSSKFEQLGSLG